MKNLLLIILLILIARWESFAQESETRTIGPFSGVKVTEGIDVYLKKGDKESVRVEVTGTKIENIITEVSGSYLRVHMRDGGYRGKIDAKVYVTYEKSINSPRVPQEAFFQKARLRQMTWRSVLQARDRLKSLLKPNL